jgi:hypothetical protein
MIDDANSRAMAHFADQDSVEENLRVRGAKKLALNLHTRLTSE